MKASKSDIIWEEADYKGRNVRLYVEDRDHIIDHHEIMSFNFHVVYDTVTTPDTVYVSRDFDNREVYFGDKKEATYAPRNFKTKVIVEYNDEEGHIVTAFPVKEEGGNIDRKIYPQDDV